MKHRIISILLLFSLVFLMGTGGNVVLPLPFIDLRAYGVIPNDSTKATTNRLAMQKAVTDHPSNVALVLPSGTIYVDRNTSTFASLSLTGTSVHDVSLIGQGVGTTKIVLQGDSASALWRGIWISDGAARIRLTGFSIEHGTVTNYSPSQQNHLITIENGTQVAPDLTRDIEVDHINFGPTIGDGIRILGRANSGSPLGQYVQNIKIHDFTMRLQGPIPGQLFGGARSGISFQRGYSGVEVYAFWMEGSGPGQEIDFEPSLEGEQSYANIHDGVINHALSNDIPAVTLSGYTTSSPAVRSQFHDVKILEGQLRLFNLYHWDIHDVQVYVNCSGVAFATALDPLLYVYHGQENLLLKNIDLTRDSTCAPGNLTTILGGGGENPSRIEIDGGTWWTKTDTDATETKVVDIESATNIRIHNTRFRFEGATPSGSTGIYIRSTATAIEKLQIDGIRMDSPNGLLGEGIYLYSNPNAISNVSITNVMAPAAASFGVHFVGTADMEPYPIFQGNDFTGDTTTWSATGTAAGKVFPIIGGNRGTVQQLEGTVAPEGNVSAIQGSEYVRLNGNSTVRYRKTTGTGNTGWAALAIGSGVLNDYTGTQFDWSDEFICQPTAANNGVCGLFATFGAAGGGSGNGFSHVGSWARPGILYFGTGSGTTARQGVMSNTSTTRLGNNGCFWSMSWTVGTDQLATATDGYSWLVGWSSDPTTNSPQDFVAFVYDRNNVLTGNNNTSNKDVWECAAGNGSATVFHLLDGVATDDTSTVTGNVPVTAPDGVDASSNLFRLKIEVLADGSEADFYVNGARKCVILQGVSNAIPQAPNHFVGWANNMVNNGAGTSSARKSVADQFEAHCVLQSVRSP